LIISFQALRVQSKPKSKGSPASHSLEKSRKQELQEFRIKMAGVNTAFDSTAGRIEIFIT
jgi:hypothetical protein